MLEPSTDQRLIMKEVVGHPWLNEASDVTSSWPYFHDRRPSGLASPEATPSSPRAHPLLDYELQSEISRLHNSCHKGMVFGCSDKNFNGNSISNFGPEELLSNHGHHDEDGNFSDHLGNANGKKTGHCQDFLLHHSPKFSPHEPFRNASLRWPNWRPNPAVGAFMEVQDFVSSKGESSDLDDEEVASVPVICEVRRPKHISLPGDVNIVYDCKTSSTTCLGATLPKSSADSSALTRAKSEPFSLALPRSRSSTSMFSSCLGCQGRAKFFREESIFEDSLNCERGDLFNFNDSEWTDCCSSEFELVRARRPALGRPDSLESTEMHVARSRENEDNFSVDSLDLWTNDSFPELDSIIDHHHLLTIVYLVGN